jgi:hypothetical protein
MTTDDEQLELKLQAKGLNAPRLTPEKIQSVIAAEYFFTAGDGAYAAGGLTATIADTLNRLTFCVLVLKNGYTVTGESACVSAKNFDAEIGKEIARKNAVDKIWQLEGYLLAERLHDRY